jgi:hypothetical protein
MDKQYKLQRYNFILTTLQKKKLELYSNQSGLSLSDIVRRSIDEYLERRMQHISGNQDKFTPKSDTV